MLSLRTQSAASIGWYPHYWMKSSKFILVASALPSGQKFGNELAELLVLTGKGKAVCTSSLLKLLDNIIFLSFPWF